MGIVPLRENLGFEEVMINSKCSFTLCFSSGRYVETMYESDLKPTEKKLEWNFISSVAVTSKHKWAWKL